MDSAEALPLVQVVGGGTGGGKLTVNSKNVSHVINGADNLPLVIITVAGPSSSGKSLVFGYLVRCLKAAEDDEFDWLDSRNPDKPMSDDFEWENGSRSPQEPGIYSFNRSFLISVGEGSKKNNIAVLLLYTQSSRTSSWDVDSGDIGALMGLSLLISSTTIFNVYKNLNEHVLFSVGNYVKYAVQGMPKVSSPKRGQSPTAPFQNTIFLVRDWNFPTEYPYGASGGKRFVVTEKLGVKSGHSKASRQSRQLINGLFQNVSGCLLPYPGSKVIESEEFTGSVGEMEPKFSKHFSDFISSVVNVDQLPVKKDAAGNVVTGRKLKEIMEGYVSRVHEMNASQLSAVSILRRFRVKLEVHPGEQKECIKVALKAYTEVWRKYEKGNKFFDERELRDIQKRARNKAVETFEKEMRPECEDDDDDDFDVNEDDDDDDISSGIDGNVKRLLMDKIGKGFEEMKEANLKRNKAYLDACKNEFMQQYWEAMTASFPEGQKEPSREYAGRESKDVMNNLSVEYLEKMGTNGDRDNMSDEQEEDMNNFMDMLADEEKRFFDSLFGNKEFEDVDNDSDDGIGR